MRRYRISNALRSDFVDAESIQQALILAKEWNKKFIAPDNDHVLHCSISAKDLDGDDNAFEFIEIYPDNKELIRRAGGNPSCYHSWVDLRDSGEGRVREYYDRCRNCGIYRKRTVFGWGKNVDQAERFEYSAIGLFH